MPRLPTILVMGSHAISTSWPGSRAACDGSGMIVVIGLRSLLRRSRFLRCHPDGAACSTPVHLPGAAGSCGEFGALVAPARLLIDGARRDTPQVADHASVETRGRARELAAGR